MQFLPRIKQQTGAVLNITTGGGLGMPVEERIAATRAVRPEMCTLNMGSMNFGIFGGIGADPDNLSHMKRIADKLFGKDYHWSILGAGRHQMPLVTQGALMGGNVRVGLEDSLVSVTRQAGDQQRRAGRQDSRHLGGARPGRRHSG